MVIKFNDQQLYANLSDDHDFSEWYVETFIREQMPWTYDLMGSAALKELVPTGRRYAEHFGINHPPNQGMFIAAMLDYGANFFTFEPMATVAQDVTLDEEVKADTLFKLAEKHRFEFEDKVEESFWHPQYVKDNILGVPYDDIDLEEFRR